MLPRSWKKRYPFRTGTTSFIYPAGYIENVDRLGPHVDEIELLMFESRPSVRPNGRLVEALAAKGAEHGLTYNIHLPTDLDLTHPDRSWRSKAGRVLRDLITLLAPLNPSVYTLHLTPPADIDQPGRLTAWQAIAAESLGEILASGVPGRRLALENLMFPFAWLDPLVEQFDLGVCMDTGHLGLQGEDLGAFLGQHGHRIVIGHLHGIRNGKDHGPLTDLPAGYREPLRIWLRQFTGSVTLEVFAFTPLLASLRCLDQIMDGPV
jgi:sugar phosphate isomerase/epimerase